MLRVGLLLCLVELAVGYPPVVKTREEIDTFRQYLEQSREDNGHRIESRMLSNVTGNVWDNSGKFEGDILLDDWQIEALVTDYAAGRNAYIWPDSRWPGNVVVFEFKKHQFSSKQMLAIRDAMRLIERNSCVKFRPRKGNEPGYALITGRSKGCHSSVGFTRTRGEHTINLARSNPGQGCLQATVIVHEWLHVLGFYHMLSTYNRDDFVRIELQNIKDDLWQRLAITDAIRLIESNSCVRFRRRISNEPNYVLLTGDSDGCYASVGFWGTRGVHTLNLARNNLGQGCLHTTVIVHEWLHVLGFFHMQSTYNRDDYVRIELQNIVDGMAHNFDKYDTNIVSNLDLPYEYTSCMHYSSHAFSKNGQPTIVPLRSFDGNIGQMERVSAYDWLRLRRHYNCAGAWNRDGLEYLDEQQPIVSEPEEISPVVVADNAI